MAAKKKSGKSRAGSATATKIQNSAARKEAVQGRRCRHLYAVLYSADRYGISLLNGYIKSGRDTAFYR